MQRRATQGQNYSGGGIGLSNRGLGGGEHERSMPFSAGSGVGDCTVTRVMKPQGALCGRGEMSMPSLP